MFHGLTIKTVDRLTDDAVSIGFDVPDNLKETFRFLPGQYLTLRATLDGDDVRRSYSICSSPGEDLSVGIKRVEEGRFSTFAQNLKPGDCVDVMQPEGRFTVAISEMAARHYLLIGAGSGITPLLSIAKSVLKGEPHSQVTLIYGNRKTETIMFQTALNDIKDMYLDRFEVFHILSREPQDVPLFNGRLTKERLFEICNSGLFDPKKVDAAYLCGPGEIVSDARAVLAEVGVPDDQIHAEYFTPADAGAVKEISSETRQALASGVAIEVILDGLTKTFTMAENDETVLSAAQRSGLDLPFSCAGGMCATCRCRVAKGAADMATNYALDDWELEAGFILACQARPTTQELVLDFDAT